MSKRPRYKNMVNMINPNAKIKCPPHLSMLIYLSKYKKLNIFRSQRPFVVNGDHIVKP